MLDALIRERPNVISKQVLQHQPIRMPSPSVSVTDSQLLTFRARSGGSTETQVDLSR